MIKSPTKMFLFQRPANFALFVVSSLLHHRITQEWLGGNLPNAVEPRYWETIDKIGESESVWHQSFVLLITQARICDINKGFNSQIATYFN